MSNKTIFLLGDFNLNALDYDTNEVVKNFFNLIFSKWISTTYSKIYENYYNNATPIDHILTKRVLENKI